MPAVLKELMQHDSSNTTMRYYVGRQAFTTAAILWQAMAGADVGASQKLRQENPR